VRDNERVSSADPDTEHPSGDAGGTGGTGGTDGIAGTGGTGAPTRAHRRSVGLFAAVAAGVLLCDVVSKSLVVAHLDYTRPVRTLGGAIYLVRTTNSGAAFSLGTGATVVLTVIALAVVAFILRTASRMRSSGWAVALGLVLGGALGNLVDRIFRAPGVGRGSVVDWISLFSDDGHVWPIFNLADSAIVVGAVLAATLALRGSDIEGSGTRRTRG
jgi:signal peptidase II